MKKGKLTTTVWGMDLTSEMRACGIGFGDYVWSYGQEGDTCWTAVEETPGGSTYTLCLVQRVKPRNDEDILNGGFVIPEGIDLVEWEGDQ